MLVHIECKDRCATSHRVAVDGSPLVDELAIARRPRQQHPARASAEGLTHGVELRTPPLDRAEISSQGFLEGGIGFTLITEAMEEMLMEDHRVHGDKFFPLE